MSPIILNTAIIGILSSIVLYRYNKQYHTGKRYQPSFREWADAIISDGNTLDYERAPPQWVALATPGVDVPPQLKDRVNHFVH